MLLLDEKCTLCGTCGELRICDADALSCTVGPSSCSFRHQMKAPHRLESSRSSTSLAHEALSHVHLVVLVKHSEVARKPESLHESTYAHAFEAQPVAEAAPSPLYGGYGEQTTGEKAFCTRMTNESPLQMLDDTKNAHGILNCGPLVCISLLALCTCYYRASALGHVRGRRTVRTALSSQWCKVRCLRSKDCGFRRYRHMHAVIGRLEVLQQARVWYGSHMWCGKCAKFPKICLIVENTDLDPLCWQCRLCGYHLCCCRQAISLVLPWLAGLMIKKRRDKAYQMRRRPCRRRARTLRVPFNDYRIISLGHVRAPNQPGAVSERYGMVFLSLPLWWSHTFSRMRPVRRLQRRFA